MIDATADARLRAARPTLADLIRIRDGSDPILTTWFMNRATHAPEELPFYPYELRRSYVAELQWPEVSTCPENELCQCHDPECPCETGHHRCHVCGRSYGTPEPVCSLGCDEMADDRIATDEVRFYAMDDASAWAWLRGTYRPESIAGVVERVVTYREVAPMA